MSIPMPSGLVYLDIDHVQVIQVDMLSVLQKVTVGKDDMECAPPTAVTPQPIR